MFDFEKLAVYQKAKEFNRLVYRFIKENQAIDAPTRNQLRRASLSIMLNIAEGSSRFSKADRRNFFVISRGSAFECVAVFDFLKDENLMSHEVFDDFYARAEELSKILFALIKNLEAK
jgi:four helix bundle protein